MIRLAMIFLFLVGTRGATFAEICLRLETDCSTSGWTVIITFFIDGDPLQKRTSGAVGRKWNGSPLLVTGSGPSCCCKRGEQGLAKTKGFGIGRMRQKDVWHLKFRDSEIYMWCHISEFNLFRGLISWGKLKGEAEYYLQAIDCRIDDWRTRCLSFGVRHGSDLLT